MKVKVFNNPYSFILLAAVVSLMTSCKKYVDISRSPNQLSAEATFANSGTATSAVLALYSNTFSTTANEYISFLGGLQSDELAYQYAAFDPDQGEFQQSAVSIRNSALDTYLWVDPYQIIGQANAVISGLNASQSLPSATKNQLLGETKFFRAFYYFNMVNFFGDIPLSVGDNALTNAKLPRNSSVAVYTQIISDLKDAENLLSSTYIGSLRTRVNKYAAAALLAKVYLYAKDYVNAEAESTKVIGSTDVSYSLPALNNAFVNTSPEIILSIGTTNGSSNFGGYYRGYSSTDVPTYYLQPGFVNSFEAGDNRLTAWVDTTSQYGTIYYRINKYKLKYVNSNGNEYDVVLRLAEQFLIRSEARAQQGNISGSQADLNAVRSRAALPNTNKSTKNDLLAAILQERKVELFGEFSNRWFDLKRTGNADQVLHALKPATWKSTALLLPIPFAEINANPALVQNAGY